MATSERARSSFTSRGATPSEAVINAVASLTGDDPLEMDPLAATIDPDALNGLFRDDDAGDGAPEVTFVFHGCEVLVRGDGSVLARRTTA